MPDDWERGSSQRFLPEAPPDEGIQLSSAKEGNMKGIFIVILAIVLVACSTHAVKCHGPLRPINKPAGVQKHEAVPDTSRTEPQS